MSESASNLSDFKTDLNEIRTYLSSKKKLSSLAAMSNVGMTTVNDTFKVNSFDELVGKKLDVYKNAIELVTQIKSLPQMANKVFK